MSKIALELKLRKLNDYFDEKEHRSKVEDEAMDLIANGRHKEAMELLKTLDDSKMSLDFNKEDTYLIAAQEAIYKELPALVEKVFHEAFMNCTQGSPVTDATDWKYIEPFVTEMERIFKLAVKQQMSLLYEVWNGSEKAGTREESYGHVK